MENCVFCKIVKGELPAYKVYEDNDFLGFLDIVPMAKGQCLLIPKKHHRWVYDVPNFGAYWEAAKNIGLAMKSWSGARSINFLTVGEEVPHAHIWIIPRHENDGQLIQVKRLSEKIPDSQMKEIAKQISSQLNRE